jgi:hypothetical protein
MANEKNDPKKPAGAAASPQKRPNTIDLTATEIKPESSATSETKADTSPETRPESVTKPEPVKPAAEPVAAPPPQRAADSAKAASENTTRATKQDTAARPTDKVPPAGDPRAAEARSGKGLPWAVIGVAFAAAVIFFAIGIGAGHWLSSRAPQPAATAPQPAVAALPPELQARIDKLEAQLGALPKEDPQLPARLAKLEAQLNAPRAGDQQLVARIAAAEAAVKTLADMTASREKRSDDIAAVASEARERASSAAAAAEAAQKSQGPSPEARADLDALNTRIASLEQSARDSQAELARRLTADDAKGRFAIAAIALRDAVASGLPFTAELAAVKSLSGDAAAFAPLEPFAASGVPSADILGRELAGLMPAIWKIARKDEPQSGSFLERLQANAEKIVRIRPAGDVAGDDPASIRARIEGRAGRADIRGALAELAKLPPDARAPAAGWIQKAEARNAAIAAARNISQSALNALVKPGS